MELEGQFTYWKSVRDFFRTKGFIRIFDGFFLKTKGFLPKVYEIFWSEVPLDGTCIIFDEETNVSTGKQQKQGRESALKLKLDGEIHFPGGSSFHLGGAVF